MAIELHFKGPGLDVRRVLADIDAPLIVGRDSDCDVCTPDPGRNVSRHHLSLCCEGDTLRFHVLSVVNGVMTSAGDAPPGARGLLPIGGAIRIAAYSIQVCAVGAADDPWSVFDREASGIAPVHPQLSQLARGIGAQPSADEDPFGDWGFEANFGYGAHGRATVAPPLPARPLQPFLRGLGLHVELADQLTEADVERLGTLARVAIEGLIGLAQRAVPAGAAAHPLLGGGSLQDRLCELVRGAANSVPGQPLPEDALRNLVDLVVHAMGPCDGGPSRQT